MALRLAGETPGAVERAQARELRSRGKAAWINSDPGYVAEAPLLLMGV